MAESKPITASRRRVLTTITGAAVATAANVGAIALAKAGDHDPIFGLIEAHKAVIIVLSAAIDLSNEMEEKIPKDRRTWSWHRGVGDGNPPADCEDDPAYLAAEIALRDAYDAEDQAIIAITSTRPTTFHGVAALLEYVGGPLWPGSDPDTAETVFDDALNTYNEEVSAAANNFLSHLAATIRGLAS